VLKHAGIDIDKVDCKHVQFDGFDKDPAGAPYGASIPIEMARMLKRDIIVAYEMNGQDIPRDHGDPVRIIIPGIVGARQVKWLTTIKLSQEESSCHWQQNDYKGFHSSIDWHNETHQTGHVCNLLYQYLFQHVSTRHPDMDHTIRHCLLPLNPNLGLLLVLF
jgi:DMSO/TMAO reductase YedYZ molybdopterin-dependent catalytic subunit